MNLVVSREDKSPFLNSWSYRFHLFYYSQLLNSKQVYGVLRFPSIIKIFRADFLMLIKFFNETTVIMYRRESCTCIDVQKQKKLFIKMLQKATDLLCNE